jgi:hypothetical protein
MLTRANAFLLPTSRRVSGRYRYEGVASSGTGQYLYATVVSGRGEADIVPR